MLDIVSGLCNNTYMNLDDNDRSWQRTETIYVTSDGVFFTPDGEGRIWFDSLAQAVEECAYTDIRFTR